MLQPIHSPLKSLSPLAHPIKCHFIRHVSSSVTYGKWGKHLLEPIPKTRTVCSKAQLPTDRLPCLCVPLFSRTSTHAKRSIRRTSDVEFHCVAMWVLVTLTKHLCLMSDSFHCAWYKDRKTSVYYTTNVYYGTIALEQMHVLTWSAMFSTSVWPRNSKY